MSLSHELPGYCIIEINGGSIERFSNLAMERNIMLWDITVIGPQRWEAKVALKSLRSLRQIGHLTESYIIVKERHSGHRSKVAPALFTGCCCCCHCFCLSGLRTFHFRSQCCIR